VARTSISRGRAECSTGLPAARPAPRSVVPRAWCRAPWGHNDDDRPRFGRPTATACLAGPALVQKGHDDERRTPLRATGGGLRVDPVPRLSIPTDLATKPATRGLEIAGNRSRWCWWSASRPGEAMAGHRRPLSGRRQPTCRCSGFAGSTTMRSRRIGSDGNGVPPRRRPSARRPNAAAFRRASLRWSTDSSGRPKSRRRRNRTSTTTSERGGPGSTATRSSSARPTWTWLPRMLQPLAISSETARCSARSLAVWASVRIRGGSPVAHSAGCTRYHRPINLGPRCHGQVSVAGPPVRPARGSPGPAWRGRPRGRPSPPAPRRPPRRDQAAAGRQPACAEGRGSFGGGTA
jgi:hypothetical protein